MWRAWRVGRLLGIDVFVHWTFLLLVGWFVVAGIRQSGLAEGLAGAGFVLCIFGCVLLHEFGHALAARRYGIPTRDITLLPIGGVARLERMPEKPGQEFVVAIAGPAVNVAIALVLTGFLWVSFVLVGPQLADPGGIIQHIDPRAGFVQRLMWSNVLLVVFNMLPAFPMDGGRVLRAVLAMGMEYRKATRIAATAGQVMAVLFAIVALFVNPFLLLISAFVFFGAAGEAQQVELRARLRQYTVADVMWTRFRAVPIYLKLAPLASELLGDMQREFPVVQQGQLCGMLRRPEIVAALESGNPDLRVGDCMQREFPILHETDSLMSVLERLDAGTSSLIPVVSEDGLVGLLDVRDARERTVPQPAPATEAPIQAEIVESPPPR